MAVDAHRVYREFLIEEGTGLHDLVGERVYWPYADDDVLGGQAAIVFRGQAAGNSTLPMRPMRFVARCYGGSLNPADADEVFRALLDRANGVNMAVTDTGVIVSSLVEEGQSGVEPDTKWPFVQCFIRAEIREQ
jgi:hypothetical protein